jgi:hypothetical protein
MHIGYLADADCGIIEAVLVVAVGPPVAAGSRILPILFNIGR